MWRTIRKLYVGIKLSKRTCTVACSWSRLGRLHDDRIRLLLRLLAFPVVGCAGWRRGGR